MEEKPLFYVGSSEKDLNEFPKSVKDVVLFALGIAQKGDKHHKAKPLKGFGGASVLEIVDRDKNATFRVVYTVKFEDVIYVLHSFKKKSKEGIKTPKQEIDLVKSRIKLASINYESKQKGK